MITTYTESNADEIREKFIRENKTVPSNVTILTWFSFLLKHGVRPYQYLMDSSLDGVRIGFFLLSGRSGLHYINPKGQPVYWGESDLKKYYFTSDYKIYSDKISKFVYVCNKQKTDGEIISRISRIFEEIYIDEVQDLAGWDLEVLLFLLRSDSNLTLVGDPKQTIYSTNNSSKHKKYRGGKIKLFLEEKAGKQTRCEIDTSTLINSHRNSQPICDFASLLYPNEPASEECECGDCVHLSTHNGIYLVPQESIDMYVKGLDNYKVLRWSGATENELTFGTSKGKTFDHVLIWPTKRIKEYLKTGDIDGLDSAQTLAKLYVAITRARYSVGFVYDHTVDSYHDFKDISAWTPG